MNGFLFYFFSHLTELHKIQRTIDLTMSVQQLQAMISIELAIVNNRQMQRSVVVDSSAS